MLFFSTSSIACDIDKTIGMPTSNNISNLIVCHIQYTSSINPITKNPDWVQAHLTKDVVQGSTDRTDAWQNDPAVPKGFGAVLSDYVGARDFDGNMLARGHLYNADDSKKNKKLMDDSFNMPSNFIPQVQVCNNSGVWRTIERVVHDWTIHYGELKVVSGPLYLEDKGYIGNGVKIPSHLFKVIYNPALGQSTAFIVPNTKLCGKKPKEFVTSQDEVERLSGITFFPLLTNYEKVKKIWE